MSDHVVGIVAKISAKPARSGDNVYNICMEIDGGDDEWFGHGFDKPEFQEGDEIEFDIEYNGDYTNVDKNTVNVLVEGTPPSRSRGRNNSSAGTRGGRSNKSSGSRAKPSRSNNRAAKAAPADDKMSKDDWAKKDKMIQLQSAMNTAIALVGVAVANDLVALPAAKGKKFDAFVALVDEEAERLHAQYLEQVYGAPKKAGRGRSKPAADEYDDDIPY